MPNLKIDGQEIPFEEGDTVIRAAWRAGIEIPHYCWHPGLSVAANCRMCLVEIKSGRRMDMPILKWDEKKQEYVPDTKPKLQPACQMMAAEGMEVETKNEQVVKAQSAVQEFLLLNHPVDCPICDQAGECKLQDYWLEHQADLKRKQTEPVHKVKGVRFGPTIVYDGERCIMCTRCIRVCDELVGDHVLDMRQRGNKNEIFLAPGRELDHGYTLMTEHVCPVGALTSRDFRFKARVWFLKSQSGVCAGCATGCNTHVDYDPRYNRVYRLRPRDNMDVNRFWMCDDGMMTYKEVHENRVHVPMIGRGDDRDEVTTKQILRIAGRRLLEHDTSRIGVVLSAGHSSEDNFVLARFAREVLGTDKLYLAANGGWEADEVLRHRDNNPNRAGAMLAGAGELEAMDDMLAEISREEIDGVLVLGHASAHGYEALLPIADLRTVISLTANTSPFSDVANIVVPVSSWAEADGTFVNAKGMSQQFRKTIPAPGAIRPAWLTLLAIAEVMEKPLGISSLAEVRKALSPTKAAAGQEEARA
ncbi:MAG: 2Fe-2S iron-sulfur cluster-binding protein [Myxococcota bacterium]